MFDTTSAPYSGWQKLGQRVLQDIESGKIAKGKGLVCVSAHWENESGNGREKEVIVNVDEGNPLIYDCEWEHGLLIEAITYLVAACSYRGSDNTRTDEH